MGGFIHSCRPSLCLGDRGSAGMMLGLGDAQDTSILLFPGCRLASAPGPLCQLVLFPQTQLGETGEASAPERWGGGSVW